MGVRWLSQSHWNNLKKRKIENSGTSNLSAPLTHAAIFDSLSKDLMEIMPRNRRKAHLIRLKKMGLLVPHYLRVSFQPLINTIHNTYYNEEHPENPANGWILDLSKKWNSHPISVIDPMFPIGNAIIDKLLSLPQAFPKYPNDYSTLHFVESPPTFRSVPSVSDVISDLVRAKTPNIYDFVNRYGHPDVEYPVFLDCMLKACEGISWRENRRLYGALDICATEDGLGSCGIEIHFNKPQEILQDDDGWSSTWTPPGAISHTHMDFYGSMQYFIHLSGDKLWLLWPPTEKNLEIFSTSHKQTADPNRTLDCILHLEGLQLLYQDSAPSPFILKPNTLHACISFTSSIHAGIRIWNFPCFDISLYIMEWALQWMRGNSGLTRSELIDEADSLQNEIKMWSLLIKKSKNTCGSPNIKRNLKLLNESLSGIRKKLEVMPPLGVTATER